MGWPFEKRRTSWKVRLFDAAVYLFALWAALVTVVLLLEHFGVR